MAPDSYDGFFLATAGAGAAFIGLLFVAISIHPQFAFQHPAPDGVPRQYLAEATLYTLANGFIISCVALVPDVDIGWVAVPLGLWGLGAAAWLVVQIDRAHRHGRPAVWPHRLRVTSLSLVGVALYASEIGLGARLIGRPQETSDWTGLALIILVLYALGMARAWTLLGDPRQGLSGWLNPLRDRSASDEPDDPNEVANETDFVQGSGS